jgi:hypothetical protein
MGRGSALLRRAAGTGIFAAAFAAVGVLAFALLPWPRALAAFVAIFAVVVVWWLGIPASTDRAWQPDVAVTPR